MDANSCRLDAEMLAQGLRQGSHEAFECLFRLYQPRLMAYAVRFVGERETASDMLQETYMRVWENRERLDFRSIRSLLFRIVHNCCLNYLKHRVVVEHRMVCRDAITSGEERLYSTDMAEATSRLLYDELLQEVRRVLDSLPERTSEVFLMSRRDGKKHREIAEELGISQKAVEKHIGRALRALSSHFRAHYAVDVWLVLVVQILYKGYQDLS